ncbi:NADH-quinone oxidoreductase subunit L [Candidatus Acetothermia bacterium]|nr:NADH-quinone oxidoreductase subunit L [Candidatus Acetothermia bacterium]MCI2432376.1 NADH-quinone oxidoreductase subunit L [Candidatus Acetothermia bacterium]MCI2435798.1 NADH-quinone oxidoreductase subunit L [Candidatus Acetothermia bacterium]
MPLEAAWLIPLLPLAASLLITVLGRKLPEGGGWVAVGTGAIVLGISLFIAVQTLMSEESFRQSFTWFSAGGFELQIGLYLDKLAALMLIVVSSISFLILVYSTAYMHSEGPRRPRYYAEIMLFLSSMLGLVLADNYLQVYIFWELVGLCSFLLIGFWFERPTAAAAAIKAFLTTRVGDLFFLIGLLLLLVHFKTLGFEELFALKIAPDQLWVIALAGLCIFGGAVGKSAQFPLHIWLPDAMEGPTTVSALIHAATMVKAGVYLVARSMPLLVQAPENLLIVATIGGFTAFLAATMALINNDIKRVLAYSTISQLGYMFLGLGVGGFTYAFAHEAAGYTASLFHLMNHAFFKALLFLGAGSVIHSMHTNDLRQMGGLRKFMPITSLTMLLASLAIAGVPPFSGFWSKDELLAAVFAAAEHEPWLFVLGVLALAVAFMTAFYMFRLWFLAFAGKPRYEQHHHRPHESPVLMTVPLMLLAVPAALSGMTLLLGFADLIYHGKPHHLSALEVLKHIFTSPLTYLSTGLASVGIGLAYAIYLRDWSIVLPKPLTQIKNGVHKLLEQKYYLDRLLVEWLAGRVTLGLAWLVERFDSLIVDGAVNLAAKLAALYGGVMDLFDRVFVDGVVNGFAQLLRIFGQSLRRTVTGLVSDYASWVVAGIVILMIFYVTRGA